VKKEIIVAAAISAAFHLGLLYGGGHGQDQNIIDGVILSDEDTVKETPPPPPPPPANAQGESEQTLPESLLPDELLSPGLNEPPASSVSMDALSQFVKPEAPHPPRPDSMVTVGIPTGARHAGGAGARAAVVFSIDQLDHIPEVRYQPSPRYPLELKSAMIEGEVVLILFVDEMGRVADVEVKSATNTGFVNNALETVRKWRFEPGLRKGKPVSFRMQQAIPFRIARQ